MAHRIRIPALLLTAVLVLALFPASNSGAEPTLWQSGSDWEGPTVLDGVYTAAQATRGSRSYQRHCAECHEGPGDGPSLFGPTFVDRWREDSLGVLFEYTQNRMPGGEPASLAVEEYLDIMAFILRSNDYPTGREGLSEEGVREILVVGPGGPAPLPEMALVRVVGCLERAGSQQWVLNGASPYVRIRSAFDSEPDEIGTAQLEPPGDARLEIRNLESAGPEFVAEAAASRRILVKGTLTRRGGAEAVNVISAVALGESCLP